MGTSAVNGAVITIEFGLPAALLHKGEHRIMRNLA
jgi:hypothetical protein